MNVARMVIGADLVDSDVHFDAVNPFTGETWATVAQATTADVDAAVAAARECFVSTWRKTPGVERARLMNALADAVEKDAARLADLETTDNGKIIRETTTQMHFTARNLRFFAGCADKIYGRTIPLDKPGMFDYTVREPYGVAALITPWNSPIAALANKLPAALAAGNTVVVKPSEHGSYTTCDFAKLALDVGFPPGVINVVNGDGAVGDYLTRHPGIDIISFTGGSGTGSRIAANAAIRTIPVTLELGGKSPNIIFDDANLDKAIPGAVAGIFAAAGQTCVAGSRLLVQQGVYDQVLTALGELAGRIKVGDPKNPATEMGPIANRPQYDRILALMEVGREQGATVVAGGGPASGGELNRGLFIEPTVFGHVTEDMRIAQEEIFGPVLSILPFTDEADAIRIANATEFGLVAGVWTQNISRAHRLIDSLDAGVVWVNTYRSNAAQAPFGGVKRSGYGRERGEDAIEEYTYVKNVMLDYSDLERDPFQVKI
ncbi:aldehyde dehydrogenase [Microbacterium aoyamense]|uniref:Aldehyde dehydrogenase n=1 Tax=Microbacterium aoyamense TaxID=344166 RepID=A0ABP5ANS4_9MICO|nr:aldehyde dehydrogenase [Microbacterium aoyamense]